MFWKETVIGLSLMLIIFSLLSIGARKEIQMGFHTGGKNSVKKSADATQEFGEGVLLYEYNMIKDPQTGKIPERIKERELEFAKRVPKADEVNDNPEYVNSYESVGPNNLGGRTRAIGIARDLPGVMLAGGVSSGIFKSNNSGANWNNVTPDNEIHNVTCILQDPRPGRESFWYYGTGELLSNSASFVANSFARQYYLGQGIYKSPDYGQSWTKISPTSSNLYEFDSHFDYVHRLTINPANGDIFAACYGSIIRSTDGGDNWQIVLGIDSSGINPNNSNSGGCTDIVCTKVDSSNLPNSGRLYAAFSGRIGSPFEGIWTSRTGDSGTGPTSWEKIAGTGSIPNTVDSSGWKLPGQYGRVVLSIAPSDQEILYTLYENGINSSCGSMPAPEADLFKWDFGTGEWVNRSSNLPDEPGCQDGNDPFACQGGYDLEINVKTDDPGFVVIGGTNAYASSDAFSTPNNYRRIGGYQNAFSYSLYVDHHPDIHTLVFHPTDFTKLFCGSDGGIHVTENVAATNVSWTSLNNEYVTFQYYHVAMDPTRDSRKFIGGAQDNGTTLGSGSSSHTSLYGGDGVSVGISKDNEFYFYGSQYGNIQRRRSGTTADSSVYIRPLGTLGGLFVTAFHLDPDNSDILYYANNSSLYRTDSSSLVNRSDWDRMTGVESIVTGDIFSFATTRGNYTLKSKLYLGTDDGRIYRLNNPRDTNAHTIPVDITGNINYPNATVSGIAVDPYDDNKVLATLSNYNVQSIWYTADANSNNPTWQGIEGNLLLPSIRSCMIVRKSATLVTYFVGTSIGLFSTNALSGSGTTWVREGSDEIGYALVSSLKLRSLDNSFLIGTHGNGMYYSPVDNYSGNTGEFRILNEGYRTVCFDHMFCHIEDLKNYAKIKDFYDGLTVSLMQSEPPHGVVATGTGDMDENGNVQINFSVVPAGNYYIRVRSLSAIETWSSVPVGFGIDGVIRYDFTLSAPRAYLSNQTLVYGTNSEYGFFSGDVNQDGIVDATDFSTVENDAFEFAIGPIITDLNADLFVDATDLFITDNNASRFIELKRP